MATLLYRLGKASFDNAWRVLIIWLVAFVAIGGGGIALGGATDEQFDIPGSPSQAAFDRLASVFPGFGTASAQAVIVAPEGQRLDSPDNTAAIEELAAVIAADEIIDDTISPFDEFAGRALSDDGRYASCRCNLPCLTMTSPTRCSTLWSLTAVFFLTRISLSSLAETSFRTKGSI